MDDKGKLRPALDELAYEAHRAQPDLVGTADLPEGELVARLMSLSDRPGANPKELMSYLSQRAGGIGSTSAVGCFPSGASPCGCEEMAGNVWEWTRSLWGSDWGEPQYGYPYEPGHSREALDAPSEVLRVLRGGAFFFNLRLARCAVRYWYFPDYRAVFSGFRVVASPFTSGL